MNSKTKLLVPLIEITALAAILLLPCRGHAQSAAFTYQGRLNASGIGANGRYDLQFSLWNAASGPAQVSVTLTNTATAVTNGLFTVTLDFGNQFPGADRWLEIGVRTNGGGAFTNLTPRQAITATPYAVRAAAAGSITGSLTGDVTGTQNATVVSTVSGVSAANVASGANAANAATSANTPNTIVRRDASGNIAAGTLTANNVSAPNLFGAIFMAGVVNPNNLTPFWTWLNADSPQTANGPSLGPPMPVACTVTSLTLRLDAISSGANSITVTLYRNGVATGMTAAGNVSTAGTTVMASDNVHTVTVAAGDSLSLGYTQTNNVPICRIGVGTRCQ